jgi:hypothetical protein
VRADLIGRKIGKVILVHPAEKLFDRLLFHTGAARLYSFFPLFARHTLSYQEV